MAWSQALSYFRGVYYATYNIRTFSDNMEQHIS